MWRLGTPLYGTQEAGLIWHRTCKKQLMSQGFRQNDYDPCHFYKEYSPGKRIDMCIFVDDGWVTDTAGELADKDLDIFLTKFKSKFKTPDHFLGMNVDIRSDHCVHMSCEAYLRTACEQYLPKPLADYPKYKVPSDATLYADYEDALLHKGEATPQEIKAYQKLVGKLIYAPPCCHPEASWAIGVMARCMTFPTDRMRAHAERALVFLGQQAALGITFDGSARNADELITYSDSDWAVAHSTTGYVACYAGACIQYGSKRQHCIALSSTEAEIIAASQAAAETVYLRGLLTQMGHKFDKPTDLMVDNSGAVALSKHRTSCNHSRHVSRRDLKVREYVAHGDINVKYVPTSENHADIFTKYLRAENYWYHAHNIMGVRKNNSGHHITAVNMMKLDLMDGKSIEVARPLYGMSDSGRMWNEVIKDVAINWMQFDAAKEFTSFDIKGAYLDGQVTQQSHLTYDPPPAPRSSVVYHYKEFPGGTKHYKQRFVVQGDRRPINPFYEMLHGSEIAARTAINTITNRGRGRGRINPAHIGGNAASSSTTS